MTVPTASEAVADSLDRAQLCWARTVDHTLTDPERREAITLLINHITTAVLLEHLRRATPDMANRLVPWLLEEEGIFFDGYAGELLHQWRGQLAAGEPMHPIGPEDTP